MLKFLRDQRDALVEKRTRLAGELDAILDVPTREKRNATPEEFEAFDAKAAEVRGVDTELEDLETRIREAEAVEERSRKAAVVERAPAEERSPSGVQVTSEPLTYSRNSGHSYYLDLIRDQLGRGDGDGGVDAARDRLRRHAQQMDVELPRREKIREQRAEQEARGRFGEEVSPFERRVNPNRTDGQGGYFVPPVWLVDDYINLPRFGRQAANLCQNFTLPAGTDSINIPKVSTGTAAAMQTADAASVTSTDLTDTSVSASVKTISGQQDIAIQLLDQSPISFDAVIFGDLIADLNSKLDIQVINGSGSSGQVTGILGTSSINAVTYTDASPTLPEAWVPLLQSASLIAKNRKMPATAVLMTPSMWYWALSQLDSTNRPLIAQMNLYNPAAMAGALDYEGPVGTLNYGLPVYLDGNIPSNLGGGTNETRIITGRWSDAFLWEGPMRTRVLQEVLSGTLQVRLQVFEYFAFTAARRPEAFSVISGTGVVPTSGY